MPSTTAHSVCSSLLRAIGVFVAFMILGGAQALAQLVFYPHGEKFPKPTPAQLDTLLTRGVVPVWIEQNEALIRMYWPRSLFTVAGRVTQRLYMTQALTGGIGFEGDLAVPLGPTDFGVFLYARANDYTVLGRDWLGWTAVNGSQGTFFNGGAGVMFDIPLKYQGFHIPIGMSVGAGFFQSQGAGPAETYIGLEPSIGLRYRLSSAVSLRGMTQATYMAAVAKRPRDIGAWNFSFGVEVALALHRREPLQFWVPPLVITAQDVVKMLWTEEIPPLDILDRNLDFINTELKPMTTFGWTQLGFRGTARGTIINSSRASSGNVTALDIRIDSADLRGFRVWRTSFLLDTARARAILGSNSAGDSASIKRGADSVAQLIRRGDYAYRLPTDLGVRYIRAELFPRAKGPLDLIPKTGTTVEIAGDIAWDGDGHIEIHPRTPNDVRIIRGDKQKLDSDDPYDEE